MTYSVIERNILSKCGKEKFSQLTKGDIVTLISELGSLDPEVQKEILKHYPEFKDSLVQYEKDYLQGSLKGLENNEKCTTEYMESCKETVSQLLSELSEPDITPEKWNNIMDRIDSIHEKMDKKDTENKKFILDVQRCHDALVIALGVLSLAYIGNKLKLTKSNIA